MKNRILRVLVISVSLVAGAARLSAGPVAGPTTATTHVNAHSTDRFDPITFRAGDEATVIVQGDGDTVLHLRVFDQRGQLNRRRHVPLRPVCGGLYAVVDRPLHHYGRESGLCLQQLLDGGRVTRCHVNLGGTGEFRF